jgi:hypothetical protein
VSRSPVTDGIVGVVIRSQLQQLRDRRPVHDAANLTHFGGAEKGTLVRRLAVARSGLFDEPDARTRIRRTAQRAHSASR